MSGPAPSHERTCTAGDFEQEVFEHLRAVDAQIHLRVKLNGVDALVGTLDAGNDLAGARDDAETIGDFVYRVTMGQQHGLDGRHITAAASSGWVTGVSWRSARWATAEQPPPPTRANLQQAQRGWGLVGLR